MRRRFLVGAALFLVASSMLSVTASSYGAVSKIKTPLTWSEQQELSASNGSQDDDFGAVAVSGDTIIVGAPQHQVGSSQDQGTAYVFTRSGSHWTQSQELTASNGAPYDQFGIAAAISGTTALIDAPFHTVGANTRQGVVYVFKKAHGTWSQTQQLTSADGQTGDYFGASLAMDRTTALIGALWHGQGAAYVFNDTSGTWVQGQEFTDPMGGGSFSHQFGTSVAISGHEAVVSAPDTPVGSNSQQGMAYVYVDDVHGWHESQAISATDGASGQEFGAGTGFGPAVAISGDTVMVGAFFTDNYHGTAYVFTHRAGTWIQTAQLTPSGLSSISAFGTVIMLSGKTAVIGAQWNGSSQHGTAYVFARSGAKWSLTQELNASNASAGDDFGSSVGLDHSTLVIGAFHVKTQTGAAYTFAAGK